MVNSLSERAFPLAFSAILFGCLPKIGDDCVTDIDCSSQGDRICDTTQPGGYCTLANCDPTSCPSDESICVSFNATRSVVGLCDNPGQASPHRRNFCMATCARSSDCRSAYACNDLGDKNVFGAEVIQKSPRGTKVCVLAQSIEEIEDRSSDYCAATGWGGAGGASN